MFNKIQHKLGLGLPAPSQIPLSDEGIDLLSAAQRRLSHLRNPGTAGAEVRAKGQTPSSGGLAKAKEDCDSGTTGGDKGEIGMANHPPHDTKCGIAHGMEDGRDQRGIAHCSF